MRWTQLQYKRCLHILGHNRYIVNYISIVKNLSKGTVHIKYKLPSEAAMDNMHKNALQALIVIQLFHSLCYSMI